MTHFVAGSFLLKVEQSCAHEAANMLAKRAGTEVAFPISGVYGLADGEAFLALEDAVEDIAQQITLDRIRDEIYQAQVDGSLFGLDTSSSATFPGFFAFDFALAGSGSTIELILVELQCAFGTYAYQLNFAKELATRLHLPDAERAAARSLERFNEIFTQAAPEHGVIVDVNIGSQQNRIDHHLLAQMTGYKLSDLNINSERSALLSETGGVIWRAMPDETSCLPDDVLPKALWWASHPGWASLYNKRLLPRLRGPYTVITDRLDSVELQSICLSDRVLKPVDGRGGNNVVIKPESEDLPERDLNRWLLQELIDYRLFSVEGVKLRAEIRALCIWSGGPKRPLVVGTLLRTTQHDQMALSRNTGAKYAGAGVVLFSRVP